jgi:hypothetical protein
MRRTPLQQLDDDPMSIGQSDDLIVDRGDAPGIQEIGFAVPERCNASEIRFDKLLRFYPEDSGAAGASLLGLSSEPERGAGGGAI